MKILLLGKDGQVGWELQRSLAPLGELIAMGRQQADFEHPETLRALVRGANPGVIVNAAAYTGVDKAEAEREVARRVNEESVRVLAEEALKLNAWLIHYSTDYVFDGKKNEPYVETDRAEPLSIYGQTKLAGEDAIRAAGCRHLIFRSSWIYSVYGNNFPLAILRRAIEREQLEVVADNFGAPTSADFIADITAIIVYRLMTDPTLGGNVSGTYHLAAAGETSWYEYAKYLVGQAKKKGLPLKVVPNRVFPIGSAQHNAAAQRPKNSRLNTQKIARTFNICMPDWHCQVARFIEEISRTKML